MEESYEVVEQGSNDDSLVDVKYDKLSGNAGIEGVLFQINLLTVFLLNAMNQNGDWRLSTENKAGDKFDDVIFEHPTGSVLLQAKHRANVSRNISLKDLLSANSKNEFCLAKYFFSYQEVKSKFKIRHVVICTDAVLKVEKDVINSPTTLPTDSVLHFENSGKLCYTFHDSIIPDLEKSINRCYGNADISKDIVSYGAIKDFLNHLQFVAGYPSGKDLDRVIESKILQSKFRENLYSKVAREFIQNRMMDWFRQKKGIYLNRTRATAIFCEIVSNKYCESLEQHQIFFEGYNNFTSTNRKVVLIVPIGDDHMYIQKVYRELKDQSALFISPDQNHAVQNQIIDSFQLHYKYLVIVQNNTLLNHAKYTCSKIKRILEKDHWKRVILIGEKEYEFATRLQRYVNYDFCRIYYDISFADLSKPTRDRFLEKEVIFQGITMPLGNLVALASIGRLKRILNLEILSKLIKNETVEFGQRVEAFKENLCDYYIFRSFIRNATTFSEHELCTLYDRIILITDSAGMGKSTVLTNFANSLKQKHPNLWVVLVNLNRYTNVLRTVNTRGIPITLTKLLNLSSTEEKIFSLPGKVVLLIDGIDEISPNYTDIVLNMIEECKMSFNFRKIFLATRPHVCEKVEEKLNVKSFSLIPFSEGDQKIFVKKYWESELELKGNKEAEEKCELYATALIRHMSKWMQERGRNAFTGIPLHLRMTAEVFQENYYYGNEIEDWEGCRQYVASRDCKQPTFPERINFIELYKMFMDKKLNIFIHEKSNPEGSVFADEAVREKLKECNAQHYALALKEVFDVEECKLFSCYGKNRHIDDQSLLNVGFVQKTGGQVNFVHRTFAEYFVAECIMNELRREKHHSLFPNFLINRVLDGDEFYIIRAFLDNLLQKKLRFLPRETFEAFHRIDYDGILRNSYAYNKKVNFFLSIVNPQSTCLHMLCHEGRSAILRFLFECSDFTDESCFAAVLTNKKIDIEARDDFGRTPLLIATENGYLDVIKMFLDRGADINRVQYDKIPLHKLHKFPKTFRIRKKVKLDTADADNLKIMECRGFNRKRESFMVAQVRDIGTFTPLHLATDRENVKVVKFLVENGADVDIQDHNGRTALHVAARKPNVELAYFLAKNCRDVNVQDARGRTALHEAARTGNESVYMLLVILGARDLVKDKNGRTPLDEIEDKTSDVEYSEAEASLLGLERNYQFTYCIYIDHYTWKKKCKRNEKIQIEQYKKYARSIIRHLFCEY